MRRILTYIAAVVALMSGVVGAMAQELRIGADFTTLFDNREYAGMSIDESGTLFSARLTPKVGIVWAERNELMFAADMVQDFGHDSKFLSDVNVQLYYAFRAPRVTALAGIFPRSEMWGLRSPLFFDRDYRYYHNRIGGVLARYENPRFRGSYVEFAMDYTGMRDFDTREAFMIMSSGCMPIGWFNFGYDFMMGHYAKDYNPATVDGVVDNILLTPYVGVDVAAGGFDIDVRLGYVQSLQRDRIHEHEWMAPCGGELYAAIGRWGVTLSNRLYMGGDLFTYFGRYGGDLYYGVPFYATTKHIYDAVTASYARSFFDGTVSIEAGITAEYDGMRWGTRQWIELGVDLDYGINLKRKKQVIE